MTLLFRLAATVVLLTFATPVFAQAGLAFDVATVRENKSGTGEGRDAQSTNIPVGPDDAFRATGGVFRAVNTPLRTLISFAYKVNTSQRDIFRASLPGWVEDAHYNVEARTERPNVTKDEMRLMMRTLLGERFALKAHFETRQVSVYAATLVKPGSLGPRLRVHPAADASCSTMAASLARPSETEEPAPSKVLADGYPRTCGDFANMPPEVEGHRREGGRDLPLAKIVSIFTGMGGLDRPTVDDTGLSGNYDFLMEFRPPLPANAEATQEVPGPEFVEALKTQLGIKLVPDRASVEFVLVDHLERPTGN